MTVDSVEWPDANAKPVAGTAIHATGGRGRAITSFAIKSNLKVVARLKEIANEKGITPSQLALAWVLTSGAYSDSTDQ